MDFSKLKPSVRAKVYIETYGCQMNVGDSQIVASLLSEGGYQIVEKVEDAAIVLLNTCAIRENAEQKIFSRLGQLRGSKGGKRLLIGVIGCMAERLGEALFDKVDIVAGPDSYRTICQLIEQAQNGVKSLNTELLISETYSDIDPVRLGSNGISAFVSIMRGCNNFCSYCVVPYTRGRERSRDMESILAEIKRLLDNGYREVTLLGQNVNSYRSGEATFAQLLERVACLSPDLRVRFATSHPKDLGDDLIETMVKHPNIARHIHLPVQSGSDNMLKAMNRKYSVEWYLGRVDAIKRAMPECTLTTDIIAGFCGESAEDHLQTISLMRRVGYDFAYMFAYSDRPGTVAHRSMSDDVEHDVKIARLNEIIATQNELSQLRNNEDIGCEFEVLVEGVSKRSDEQLYGRTSGNKVVVFDSVEGVGAGDYVRVVVDRATSATLIGHTV